MALFISTRRPAVAFGASETLFRHESASKHKTLEKFLKISLLQSKTYIKRCTFSRFSNGFAGHLELPQLWDLPAKRRPQRPPEGREDLSKAWDLTVWAWGKNVFLLDKKEVLSDCWGLWRNAFLFRFSRCAWDVFSLAATTVWYRLVCLCDVLWDWLIQGLQLKESALDMFQFTTPRRYLSASRKNDKSIIWYRHQVPPNPKIAGHQALPQSVRSYLKPQNHRKKTETLKHIKTS